MSELTPLAKAAGIELSYVDVWGNVHETSEETLENILNALGLPSKTQDERSLTKERLEAESVTLFPLVKVLAKERRYRLATAGAVRWRLRGEDNKLLQGDVIRDAITLPPLEMGYYRLEIDLPTGGQVDSLLIVAPETCWQPERIEKGERIWGLSVQLYSLRSEKNWGIGDFGDLAALVETAGARGIHVIGLNPLHALYPSNPYHYAPYTPSSRLFLNTLYLDVTAIDGYTDCEEVSAITKDPGFQEKLTHARDVDLIDYALVAELKYKVLEPLFQFFKKQGPSDMFDGFCQEKGEALQRHAIFEAISEHFKEENGHHSSWAEWPDPFKNPDSAEVKAFAVGKAERVKFYVWLQWLADQQLRKAQERARNSGMIIGLYGDLAVGSDKGGAEMWANPVQFIDDVAVGAPPDEYNPGGQNWGLPAVHPYKLRKYGYQSFIEFLRANMRHCGALRIDHAFGLSRLFLIPKGKSAAEGAYLQYPFDELLAVLKVESHRNECMIIGEDLGNFPPDYKEKAARAGLLSYKVLYFERENDATSSNFHNIMKHLLWRRLARMICLPLKVGGKAQILKSANVYISILRTIY